MADDADFATDLIEEWTKQRIQATRADIIPGEPGVCYYCDTYSPRLIKGACARCRDKYDLE